MAALIASPAIKRPNALDVLTFGALNLCFSKPMHSGMLENSPVVTTMLICSELNIAFPLPSPGRPTDEKKIQAMGCRIGIVQVDHTVLRIFQAPSIFIRKTVVR